VRLEVSRDRVQLTDAAIPVPCVPDEPLLIDDQIVRVGSLFDGVPAERLRRRIEAGDVVSLLADEPDLAVRCDEGVAYAATPLYGPLLQIHRRRGLCHERGGCGEGQRGKESG